MKKKVFFSFHYDLDNWRVQQIRNMGVVEGQKFFQSNEWEEVKRKGEQNVKNWINEQIRKCDCVIVLIGKKTHTRKWVKYEVERAKQLKKPIFGIFIHNLRDREEKRTTKGENVFDICCYEPNPCDAYKDIKNNLENWIVQNSLSNNFDYISPTERW